MTLKPVVIQKTIRLQVPTQSFVHADGRSTMPPAVIFTGATAAPSAPIETVTTSIPITWFDDDQTDLDFVDNLTDAVGTVAYLVRLRTYWELDLAGRLNALTYANAASGGHTKAFRIFSIELPYDAMMTTDIRAFSLASVPYSSTASSYDVDLPNLSTVNTIADIKSALGHLAYLGFLTSMWHADLWRRMGFSPDSWT